jgi:hypothetical protein
LDEIDEMFTEYNWLTDINSDNYQKRLFNDLNEELQISVAALNKMECYNGAKILAEYSIKMK